jgi:hypothetical protein
LISCLSDPNTVNDVEQAPAQNLELSEEFASSPSEEVSSDSSEVDELSEAITNPPQTDNPTVVGITPEISADDTPEITPLELVSQGYNQTERQIVYAFVVENLNQDSAIADSKYEVTAYDSTGVSLASDSEFLALLLPNQQLGISGNLFLEQSTPVALITVRLETGQPQTDFLDAGLATNNVRHWPGERYDRVTAVVSNDSPDDLEQIRLAAIAYDSQGDIIGAGHSLLNFMLAGRETGVDITIDAAGEIDRIELFPRISPAPLLSSVEQVQVSGGLLSLLDSGFSQQDIEFSYGFLYVNRNPSFAVEDSLYRLTAFNDEGDVIAVDEGKINLILPGQTLGMGKLLFIENEEVVDRIDLAIQPGSAVLSPDIPSFEVQDLELGEAGNRIDLSGQILNPFDKILENISLYIIFFDQDGLIIGGSSDNLELLPAADSIPVELNIQSPVTPVSAQLFASVKALDDLE